MLDPGLFLELCSGILGVILFIALFKRYLTLPTIATLWLFLFALIHGINNLVWFYSDLPEIESLFLATLGYATYGLMPLFAMLFTAELIGYKKPIYAISIFLASLFLILNVLFPPQRIFIEGIGFWVPSKESFYPYMLSTVMCFFPTILFLFYWESTKDKKGIYLSVGFLFMALFESLFEANMLLPLYITNLFELAGLLILFFVYTRRDRYG